MNRDGYAAKLEERLDRCSADAARDRLPQACGAARKHFEKIRA